MMGKKMMGLVLAGLATGSIFAMGVFSGKSDVLAPGMTPGGVQKKNVGLFFDVMNTTPSNILANADQFAEHVPYLDGVAICLKNVLVVGEGGSVATSAAYQIMKKSERWTKDSLRHHIPTLRQITAKPCLSESLLYLWITPQKKPDRLDWRDDKAWANFAENLASMAWLAKEGGLKGLMLDPEEYCGALQYIQTPADPSFDECKKLARQRGREVFSRVFQEYPDMVLFTLWYFAKFRAWMENGAQTHPDTLADDCGELLQYFYNGILDIVPPGVKIVDGCEHYSHSATRFQYMNNAIVQSTGALAFVDPVNYVKYRSQVLYSSAHYFDMYRTNANPKSIWYHGPVNGSRLEHLRLNIEQSLYTATEYVWLYGEGSGKLFNWRDGHYSHRQTWEELIPGMTETIMVAKDPERWAAMQRKKLAAEGKLVNLLADQKAIKIANPVELRQYNEEEKDLTKVDGVRPGDRYLVSVMIQAARAEAACPMIIWKAKGKTLDIKPLRLNVPEEVTQKMIKVENIITIPEGVDEFVVDLAGKLNADERVSYRQLSIRNIYDPVDFVTPKASAKWVFDKKARTLTDGNWKLTASERDGKLLVTGNGKNTVGKGVLDLSTVKADTGYEVSSVGNFGELESITGVYAPNVSAISTRAFLNCKNIRSVVIGETPVSHRAVTANDRRLERLSNLGISRQRGNIAKRAGYFHSPYLNKFFGKEICIDGVKPGELYNIGLSMKRTGSGVVFAGTRFYQDDKAVGEKRNIGMREPRKDGVWRSGEILVRVPDGANKLCFDFFVQLIEGPDSFEFDKFFIYKLSDGLPVWPAEALKEKER